MKYNFLPEHLHTTADLVASFLKSDRGIIKFTAETQVDKQLEYRPTLHGFSRDQYIVAVEVQESANSTFLDSVILDCMTHGIPIKLFIAFPTTPTPIPHQQIQRAHDHGLGIIEVQAAGPAVLREALPLSLLGYRLDRRLFPPRYRGVLADAENTFRDGSPVKACSIVYDEIEHLSRATIRKTKKKRMWRKLKPGEKAPKLKIDTGPWESVLETFEKFFDRKHFPSLSANLVHRIAGITAHRNQAGHKPASIKERTKRDREIKTRFESAVDLLHDLIGVASKLK